MRKIGIVQCVLFRARYIASIHDCFTSSIKNEIDNQFLSRLLFLFIQNEGNLLTIKNVIARNLIIRDLCKKEKSNLINRLEN